MNRKQAEEANTEANRREAITRATASFIRKQSEAGKLVLLKDVLQVLREQNVLGPEKGELSGEDLEALVTETFRRNEDLKEIPGHDGLPRYYSGQYMSDAYARLLVRKEGDPLLLLAETIRENSKIYPRPVPMETFKNPPFDLTEEEILACLEKMKEEDPYKDIGETVTSEGTVFLYSAWHLEPDYASMLAEWIDVGQHKNP